jgi:hypothetical protein
MLPGSLLASERQCNLSSQWACHVRPPSGAGVPPALIFIMRCAYCRVRAGILRTVCPQCADIITIIEESAGRVGWTELIDLFAEKGFTKAEVDRVLDADTNGSPTLRDQLTSRMANELMRSLGMPGRQSPEDVRRVRLGLARGIQAAWSASEKPPDTAKN